MDIQFYGANCLRISTKKASIVVDDNLADLGAKSITKSDDIALHTSPHIKETESRFLAAMPGEYEISGVVIQGIAARAFTDHEHEKSAVIFKINADDNKLVVLGHIDPGLSEEQLEAIGTVDILIIPVGNGGYTIGGDGALKLIRKIEPKLVVPTHYADSKLKFEVPQQPLDAAIKDMGMEISETVPRLKPKTTEYTDVTRLVVIEKQ